MPREVTDGGGVKWVCAQAYGGIKGVGGNEEAARVEGAEELFHVVCTPGGGEQTVRLKLKGGWEDDYTDEQLLKEIESAK